MCNCNNTVVISADRNGSTAFIESIKKDKYNQLLEINLGECFSQDYEDNPRYPYGAGSLNAEPRPKFWNEQLYTPSQVINTINIGTGKKVLLKCLITWQNFNESYFDINSKRKIFLHRNIFDSSLSRCLAQKIGQWHNETNADVHTIPEDFFISTLEFRIGRYDKFLDQILNWTNEIVFYETFEFKKNIVVRKNTDRINVVSNYKDLKKIYNQYKNTIDNIEKNINKKDQTLRLLY